MQKPLERIGILISDTLGAFIGVLEVANGDCERSLRKRRQPSIQAAAKSRSSQSVAESVRPDCLGTWKE